MTFAIARKPAPESTQRRARGAAPRAPARRPTSTAAFAPPDIQRTPSCACGGGCPTCEAAPGLQTKLTISQPGDRYEREADRVAEQVMRMAEPASAVAVAGGAPDTHVQRCQGGELCGPCARGECSHSGADEPAALLQRQVEEPEEDEEELLQAKASPGQTPTVTPHLQAGVQAMRGGGQPLPATTRTFFEPRFGADFSSVRVHTGAAAVATARETHARAFTLGRDVVFARGQYAPETTAGRHLLAHELAHVVQQSYRRSASPDMIMGRWDRAPTECRDIGNRWIERVVVEQESPQSVTIHWNDGSLESDTSSAGKGHCCADPATTEGVACTVRGSRISGSNCTPITEVRGYPVRHRDRVHNGWDFWTEFVPARGIALHYYPRVDGTALSHGCVRLHKNMAQKVFCGSRQNRTWVQVRGFARPMCDWPALQGEWVRDFRSGGQDLSAFDGDRDRQASIRETRRMLNAAFGRNLTVDEIRALKATDIPKCGATAARPSGEQARLTAPVSPSGTVPARILAASGFDARLTPFTSALARVRSLRSARRTVRRHGRALWRASVARARGTTASTDDRALYWARLQMARALRQFEARFRLNASDRKGLLELFERASRGMETAAFRGGEAIKKILISGFDPFALAQDIRRGNPSGSAVLTLDGKRITDNGITAEVQGVVFPVRFADFNAGIVESFFRRYLSASAQVDMIMTISMGGRGSNVFEVEEYAGRRRAAGAAPGNLGQTGGGTRARPAEPPGLGPGPEFIRTTLPTREIRSALGRTSPLPGETQVTEIPAGGTRPVPRTRGPTRGSIAVRGSGGAFLSNEIFYRTRLLRLDANATIPVGHLHTPDLGLPSGTEVTSAQFQTARNEIVKKVEEILKAALPAL